MSYKFFWDKPKEYPVIIVGNLEWSSDNGMMKNTYDFDMETLELFASSYTIAYFYHNFELAAEFKTEEDLMNIRETYPEWFI